MDLSNDKMKTIMRKRPPTPVRDMKRILFAHKRELRKKYGVKEIGIFGSFARNENRKGSDIDILVEIEKPMGFFTFMRMFPKNIQILFTPSNIYFGLWNYF